MPNQFKHYWPLSKDEKNDIWENGTIVLDTNVLFLIYRLPKESRNSLLKVLENTKIKDRIWIPNRVAEEFFQNRLDVINTQISSVDTLKEMTNDFIKSISQFVRKHHPLINLETWKDETKKCHEKIMAQIEKKREDYPVSEDNDQFLPIVQQIMDKHVGDPLTDDEYKKAEKDAEDRYHKKIPPGYMDRNKDQNRGIGDYIIWKQILKEMGSRTQNLIFVTDDLKEDWWLIRHGKHTGPRPELRAEYKDTTSKEMHMTSPERFMDWAKEYLALEFDTNLNEAIVSSNQIILQGPLVSFYPVSQNMSLKYNVDALQNTWFFPIHSAQEMAKWFLDNYVNPDTQIPIDLQTSFFPYLPSILCDPRVELAQRFPSAPLVDIFKAEDIIAQSGCTHWMKKLLT